MTRLAKEFGANLRRYRERAALTQAALAEHAGVTDETISRLERGAFEPALSTALALADALGCSVDELCGHAAPSPRPRESPFVRRLVVEARRIGAHDQRALLRVAERMPSYSPEPRPGRRPKDKG